MTPPTYFFDDRRIVDRVRSHLTKGRHVVLFLDYDGTLVPFRRRPSSAFLSFAIRAVLLKLARRSAISLAIVTGRSLEDIQRRVRLRNVVYVGNHGLQISISGTRWTHPEARRRSQLLARIVATLRRRVRPIPGVLVQNKRLTVSIHTRNVCRSDEARVQTIITEIIGLHRKSLTLSHGNKVFEVLPAVSWNKGHACLQLLTALKLKTTPVVLYLGDDTTDEKAFELLRSKAITIRVGKNLPTLASYFLRNSSDVQRLLSMILSLTQR